MRFRFRPLPGFTVFAMTLFAALASLGLWQLHRLEWKLALIAEIDRNTHASPVPAQTVLGARHAEYRHVSLNGRFLNSREAYVFATDTNGQAGYHVLTPFVLDTGQILVVDRGFVPPDLRDPATRRSGQLEGERQLTGILRVPDPPGAFTPEPDRAHRIWYARDIQDIAAVDRVHLSSMMVVEADTAPVRGGWPRGGQTVIALPNNHLQYAITWFLLAGALLVVYLAYHRARGRLNFTFR